METERKEDANTSDCINNRNMHIPGTSNSFRLGMCEVCAVTVAKYTCPRCEVKTCSLRCSKVHKTELECDGSRDKTKFIPVNKFSNLDLLSDYRLLEEITRNVETLRKSGGKRFQRPNGELPNYLYKLRKAVNDRKTILKFLPKNFTRRKQNTTRLHYNSNVIFWHIEWIFSNADNLKLTDDNVPETTKLNNLLHKYFIKQEDKVLQEKLQFYQAVDLPGVKLFLKAEQKGGCKYYELDPLVTLKENLKNKIIIEYPIIHVVFKEHAYLYDVLDSDEENEDMDIDIKSSNGEYIVNQIIKKAEKEENLNSSLKNLLFISENSDCDNSDTDENN